MIDVLQLGRTYGATRLQETVTAALALGCPDASAIRHLLMTASLTRPAIAALAVGALAQHDRPLPSLAGYDALLAREAAS